MDFPLREGVFVVLLVLSVWCFGDAFWWDACRIDAKIVVKHSVAIW